MRTLYLFLLLPFFGLGQTQIGDAINGVSAGDYYGEKIGLSSDGTTLIVASREYNSYSGLVRVYKNISNSWIQQGQDLTGLMIPGSFFGSDVAISSNGNIIAVSSINTPGNFYGKVRLYENISDIWTQIGEINDADTAEVISLSADGNTLAIGDPYNAVQNTAGKVKVYTRSSGSWIPVGQDINGFFSNMAFGKKVALSGDGTTLAIGAPYYEQFLNSGGIALVYRNINSQWVQIGQGVYGEQNFDYTGDSISLSYNGNILAVGTPLNGSNGSYNGKVRIYVNNNDVWEPQGVLTGDTGDFFGASVSLSEDGTMIAVGSNQNSNNGFRSGNTKLFKYLLNTWSQVGNTINGQAAEDYSSSCVSLSASGLTLAINAPQNDTNGNNSGQVRVYDLSNILSSKGFNFNNFTISPNPTSDIVNINLKDGLELQKVNIYTTSGQLLKTEKSNSLKINNLSKGTYYIEVVTNKGKATKTIVVE